MSVVARDGKKPWYYQSIVGEFSAHPQRQSCGWLLDLKLPKSWLASLTTRISPTSA